MTGHNATAAESLGTSIRSDVPIGIEGRALCTKDGCSRLMKMCCRSSFPFALHQNTETEKLPCQRAGMSIGQNSTWLLTAVLTRATHEQALIGHREPDSGRSHVFFRTIGGGIALEALMAALHAAPGPPALDLVPAAPHRWLARMPMLMGGTNHYLHELDPPSARKRQRHPAIGSRYHIPELVTAKTVTALRSRRERAVNDCECKPVTPKGHVPPEQRQWLAADRL